MICLILLIALNLVYADDCLLDNEIPEFSELSYSIVKPLLSYLPSVQKRLEACEDLKPPYPQDRLYQIENQLKQMELHSTNRIQFLEEKILSGKIQCEEQYNTNEQCDAKLQNLNKSLIDCRNEIDYNKFQIEFIEKLTQYEIELRKNEDKKIEERKKKFSNFQKIGSKYYFLNTQKENWFEALHSCLRLGSNLASPQNEEELNELTKLAAKFGGDYWLDIHDKLISNYYMSATTGEKANFLKWSKGEPNHARIGENCVLLLSNVGLMNDRVCSHKLHFICEANVES